MWQIYDDLIALIPPHLTVQRLTRSQRRIYVQSDAGVGTAMLFTTKAVDLQQDVGADLHTVAKKIKSWDFNQASIGLAAINSYLNQPAQINQAQLKLIDRQDVFEEYLHCRQKMATIGHFHYLDHYPELKKRLTVFELQPSPGDYPASASEFLLPQMQVVFITASTLVNKTLPRLLTLAQHAEVILVGGSTPLADTLFQHGIHKLAATYLTALPQTKKTKGQALVYLEKGTSHASNKAMGIDRVKF